MQPAAAREQQAPAQFTDSQIFFQLSLTRNIMRDAQDILSLRGVNNSVMD